MTKKVFSLMAATLFAATVAVASISFSGNAEAKKKCGNSLISTECGPETNNQYQGTGGKKPNLRPTVCLPDWAYDMMTGPGVNFWYDYELVYVNGAEEKGDGVVRTQCSKKQWVSSGMRLKFWVDCEGYRWYFTTAALRSNGTYEFQLVKKRKI